MPRFHLHVRDGGRWIADVDGIDCAGLDIAAAKAAEKARAQLKAGSTEEVSAIRALECAIVVADEAGRLVLAVPCYEASYVPGFEPLRLS